MYQAVYSPNILVNLSRNNTCSNNSGGDSIITVVQTTTASTPSTNLLVYSNGNGSNVNNPPYMYGIEMAPIRNQRNVMPPPPHSYLNNNSLQKNYNNGTGTSKYMRSSINSTNYWLNNNNNGGGNISTPAESGDCIRSRTPRSYDSDDSCKSQPQSPLPEMKGYKQYEVYGTQQAFYQRTLGALHSSSGFFYNNNNNHSNNNNNNNYSPQQQRSQSNSNLSNLSSNCTIYQAKRRLPNSNRNNGNRHRRSLIGGVQQLIAPDRYLARANEIVVRGEPKQLLNGSCFDNLSRCIWNHFISNQQTINTYKGKMNLWKSMYILIKTNYPRYGLFLVGSTISGFGSNSSDMDMCLLVRPTEMDQRCEAVVHLAIVQRLLKQCDFISNVELIQAKVPILKFRDANNCLEVDLNCNNSVGIRNTHLLRSYANMDWRVRPLVLIVKLWARHHHINDAKNMTISSYSLALMVINFLQCGIFPPVVPNLQGIYPAKFSPLADIHTIDMHEQLLPFQSDNTNTLGELFLEFLRYYSTFDYSRKAISVRLATCIDIDECKKARTVKNDPHQWKHLCVEEPFDGTNTARSVYDGEVFERVKIVFIHSYQRLRDTLDLQTLFTDSFMPPPSRIDI